MVSGCYVPSCRRKFKKGSGISFHEFPSDPKLRQEWIKAVRCEGSTLNFSSHKICSDHFKETDYIVTKKIRLLKKGAVPSYFPGNSETLPPNGALSSVCRELQTKDEKRKGDADTLLERISSLLEATSDVLFKCCICTYDTRDQRGIISHLVAHGDDEQELKCQHCPKSFSRIQDVRDHFKIHKRKTPFACFLCPAVFHRNSDLFAHAQAHAGQKPYECRPCLMLFPAHSHLHSHVRTDAGGKPSTCLRCPEALAMSSSPPKHCQQPAMPFKCTSCPRAFSQKIDCDVHMLIHTSKGPYKCTSCPRAFSQKIDCDVHMLIHTSKRPYKCTSCPWAFSDKIDYEVHMLTHASKGPYK